MEKKAFYDKFTAKKSSKISAEKQRRKEFNKERDEFYEGKKFRRHLKKLQKVSVTLNLMQRLFLRKTFSILISSRKTVSVFWKVMIQSYRVSAH